MKRLLTSICLAAIVAAAGLGSAVLLAGGAQAQSAQPLGAALAPGCQDRGPHLWGRVGGDAVSRDRSGHAKAIELRSQLAGFLRTKAGQNALRCAGFKAAVRRGFVAAARAARLTTIPFGKQLPGMAFGACGCKVDRPTKLVDTRYRSGVPAWLVTVRIGDVVYRMEVAGPCGNVIPLGSLHVTVTTTATHGSTTTKTVTTPTKTVTAPGTTAPATTAPGPTVTAPGTTTPGPTVTAPATTAPGTTVTTATTQTVTTTTQSTTTAPPVNRRPQVTAPVIKQVLAREQRSVCFRASDPDGDVLHIVSFKANGRGMLDQITISGSAQTGYDVCGRYTAPSSAGGTDSITLVVSDGNLEGSATTADFPVE